MTDSIHIEGRFSELFDGSLPEQEEASAREHLARCDACRTSYASFEEATTALRSLRLAATSPAYVDDIMAGVSPTPVPSHWQRTRTVLTHAAALLLGLGIAWALGSERSLPSNEGVDEPRTVEVVREVPVDVIREVPVEVVRATWIERIEYVDRPVEEPERFDVEEGRAILAGFARAFTDVAVVAVRETRRRNAERAEWERSPVPAWPSPESDARKTQPVAKAGAPSETERDRAAPEPVAQRGAVLARAESPVHKPDGPLRILRTDDRVRIRTKGPLSDVVPALIDTLDDEDRAVALAAEQHLETLHAELFGGEGVTYSGAPKDTRVSPRKRPSERLFGLFAPTTTSEDEPPAPDPRAEWTEWWLDHSTTLAASDVH